MKTSAASPFSTGDTPAIHPDDFEDFVSKPTKRLERVKGSEQNGLGSIKRRERRIYGGTRVRGMGAEP